MSKLLDDIRQAILESDKTRYRIALDNDIDQAHLTRLMHGQRGLSIETLEKLLDYLGLEIIIRPKHKKKGG